LKTHIFQGISGSVTLFDRLFALSRPSHYWTGVYNNLKRLRDVISHITDWDKSEAAWKDHSYHSLTGKYVDDCVNVSAIFFQWFHQINKNLASRYQEILKAIDAPFQENLKNYFQKHGQGDLPPFSDPNLS